MKENGNKEEIGKREKVKNSQGKDPKTFEQNSLGGDPKTPSKNSQGKDPRTIEGNSQGEDPRTVDGSSRQEERWHQLWAPHRPRLRVCRGALSRRHR